VIRADVLAAVEAARLRLNSMDAAIDELQNDLRELEDNLDSIADSMDEEGDE
jgi:hypothetical protein